MDLRVACNTDAEVVPVLRSNKLYQINCEVKSVFLENPVCGTSRRVSSESKKVTDALSFRLVKAFNNLLTSHVCASDMHQHVNLHILLNVCAKL